MVDSHIYQYLFYSRPKFPGKRLTLRIFFILFGINLLFLFVLDIFENLIGMPIFQHAIHDDAAGIFEDLGWFLIFAGLFTPVIEELVFRYHLVIPFYTPPYPVTERTLRSPHRALAGESLLSIFSR